MKLAAITSLSKLAQNDPNPMSGPRLALTHFVESEDPELSRGAGQGLSHPLRVFAMPSANERPKGEAPTSVVLEPSYNLKLQFQHVPAGAFLMGSDTGQKHAKDNEMPLHVVDLPSYWMARHPITKSAFSRFVKETGYVPDSDRADGVRVAYNRRSGRYEKTGKNWKNPFPKSNNYDVFQSHPAVYISFWDSLNFCQWASSRTGLPIALPTEAEWEKAARGYDQRVWPWGNEPPTAQSANFAQRLGSTSPVGTFSEAGDSPFGCADMSGNVWEWTTSTASQYPYSFDRNPEDLKSNTIRILRGGSWRVGVNRTTVSFRKTWEPKMCCDGHGFRPVIRIGEEELKRHLGLESVL